MAQVRGQDQEPPNLATLMAQVRGQDQEPPNLATLMAQVRGADHFIERFHRTLLDEHLRVKGRATWYETTGEMQTDLEAYLELYITKRPHRGRGMDGRTPYQVFKTGLKDAKKPAKATSRGEEQQAA